jgi:hypothetical protein
MQISIPAGDGVGTLISASPDHISVLSVLLAGLHDLAAQPDDKALYGFQRRFFSQPGMPTESYSYRIIERISPLLRSFGSTAQLSIADAQKSVPGQSFVSILAQQDGRSRGLLITKDKAEYFGAQQPASPQLRVRPPAPQAHPAPSTESSLLSLFAKRQRI